MKHFLSIVRSHIKHKHFLPLKHTFEQ